MDENKTSLHRRKRAKNLTVLAIILGWCALIWLITMVRLAHGQEMPNMTSSDISSLSEAEESLPHDLDYFFSTGRSRHQLNMDNLGEQMEKRGEGHQNAMDKAAVGYHDRGTRHQNVMDDQLDVITERGAVHQASMDTASKTYQENAAVHQQGIAANPDTWWTGWQDRLFPADYGEPPNQQ